MPTRSQTCFSSATAPGWSSQLKEVVLHFFYLDPARAVAMGQAAVGKEVLGPVVLKLDGVGTSQFGSLDCALCKPHISVVVEPNLGNDVAGA